MGWPTPVGGWPEWVSTVPYVGKQHPQAAAIAPIVEGANCQRYAYAVLELFGVNLPPYRSSELWSDSKFQHLELGSERPLDLVLFNQSPNAWGAHVAVYMGGDQLLHLCSEAGHPVTWSWADFAARPGYASVIGIVRPDATSRPVA